MNEAKQSRLNAAQQAAAARRKKALVSLSHCLGRSDVMRMHHDLLIDEMPDGDLAETFSDAKKLRLVTYVTFWFAGLCGVIERYEELAARGTIPRDTEIDELLDTAFKSILKPFRNSVAHCNDHDDPRTLQLFGHVTTVPDKAAQVSKAFRAYIDAHLASEP